MRKITGIIIHCTATRPDWWAGKRTSEKVAEIKRWHVDGNGWNDIGYHYLIDRDGTIAKGRDVERTGAHVAGHNTGTIGISLFGGHGSNENDDFSQHFTAAQDKALRGLLDDLRRIYGSVAVTGHNQYAAKACPGFTVSKWLAFGGNRNSPPLQAPPAPDTPPTPATPPQRSLWAALASLLAGFFGKDKA